MVRKAVIGTALSLATALAGMTAAAPAQAATAPIEQRCTAWQQPEQDVWIILCLYRQGVLYQPIATIQNNSPRAVAYDALVELNGAGAQLCGGWPTATLPAHANQTCTNGTWIRSDTPATATLSAMVDFATPIEVSTSF